MFVGIYVSLFSLGRAGVMKSCHDAGEKVALAGLTYDVDDDSFGFNASAPCIIRQARSRES